MAKDKLTFCVFGAGRIGKLHARNVAAHPRARVKYIVDPVSKAAAELAQQIGARTAPDPATALADPEIDAVVVASSTNTHVDLLTGSAPMGQALLCEKPIDLDIKRVNRCLADLKKHRVPVAIGFNRRFDPTNRALQAAIRKGEVGEVELVVITSRDPGPPPLEYIKVSGGLFRDMMIHDFDLARWLLGAEPVEVAAKASCRVDPKIARAGDVDSAMVILKTRGGALCQKAVRLAIEERHLRSDTDPEQIAFELLGIVLASHNHRRLLGDKEARKRALTAFDELIARHAAPARPRLRAASR